MTHCVILDTWWQLSHCGQQTSQAGPGRPGRSLGASFVGGPVSSPRWCRVYLGSWDQWMESRSAPPSATPTPPTRLATYRHGRFPSSGSWNGCSTGTGTGGTPSSATGNPTAPWAPRHYGWARAHEWRWSFVSSHAVHRPCHSQPPHWLPAGREPQKALVFGKRVFWAVTCDLVDCVSNNLFVRGQCSSGCDSEAAGDSENVLSSGPFRHWRDHCTTWTLSRGHPVTLSGQGLLVTETQLGAVPSYVCVW